MSNPVPNQPEISESPSSAGSPADAPTHFDDLIGGAPAAPAAPTMLSKDEFHKVFIGGFKAGHLLTKFQSLHIGPEREASAEACSHAIYESIVDIPSLHFMLTPNSKWFGRAIAIGAFTIPTAIGISHEIRARKAAAAKPAQAGNFTAAKTATAEPSIPDPANGVFTQEQEDLFKAANGQ